MNNAVLHSEVQQFIDANLQVDISRLVFQKSPFANVSTAELAKQIDSKKRTEKKLPPWFNTQGIYYPPKLAIEQASSQATALYKNTLIKGKNVIDLTGGFGADSYFFSLIADEVTHCETDAGLCGIAKHNAAVLKADNIRFIHGDGIGYFINNPAYFDTVYIDPSRRVNTKKVYRLKDSEPDVVANLDKLLQKSGRIIIKTAPLLDIQSGLTELHHVSQIHIVSVKNDCKELLWVIDNDFNGAEPLITCAALHPSNQLYQFKPSEEKAETIINFSKPLQFVYEPDVALLKAGCFKLIARDFDVLKLNPNTHIYTADELKPGFFGRKFRLLDSWEYKTFSKTLPVKKANIICRNFPLSPAEVKKKHKLEDGGDEYLIFTKGPGDELLVLWCERLG